MEVEYINDISMDLGLDSDMSKNYVSRERQGYPSKSVTIKIDSPLIVNQEII